jgi:hypothetical protein
MRVWELLLQSVNCHWSLVIGHWLFVIGHGLLLLYLPHSLRPLSFGTDKYKKNIPLFTVNSQQSTVNNQQSAVNNQQSTINNQQLQAVVFISWSSLIPFACFC